METERQQAGVFTSGRSVRPSFSPGSLFGSQRSRRCSPGEAPSPSGAGELSPAGSRSARRPGTTRGGGRFRITDSPGSERWGRGDSQEGRGPRATPFAYAFPLLPLQLPAAPAKDFLPPHPTASRLRAHLSDPSAAATGGWGVRQGKEAAGGKVGTLNANSHPLAETTKCVYTGNDHSPVAGLPG